MDLKHQAGKHAIDASREVGGKYYPSLANFPNLKNFVDHRSFSSDGVTATLECLASGATLSCTPSTDLGAISGIWKKNGAYGPAISGYTEGSYHTDYRELGVPPDEIINFVVPPINSVTGDWHTPVAGKSYVALINGVFSLTARVRLTNQPGAIGYPFGVESMAAADDQGRGEQYESTVGIDGFVFENQPLLVVHHLYPTSDVSKYNRRWFFRPTGEMGPGPTIDHVSNSGTEVDGGFDGDSTWSAVNSFAIDFSMRGKNQDPLETEGHFYWFALLEFDGPDLPADWQIAARWMASNPHLGLWPGWAKEQVSSPVQSVANWKEYLSSSRTVNQTWSATKRASLNPGSIAAQIADGDLIGTIGGPNVFDPSITSPGDTQIAEYMTEIIAVPAALANFKSLVYAAALETIAAQAATGNTAFWLMGNEINKALQSLAWQDYAPGVQTGLKNDQSFIGTYLEAEVALMIEQVLLAEAATGGDIKLFMGSIAGGSEGPAMTWATAALNYVFLGTYAPALAGYTLRELVEGTAFHYSMTEPGYETTLAFYHDQIGTGAIEYSFDTEEVGDGSMSNGVAPKEALLLVVRTLKWVANKLYTPTDFRANVWSVGEEKAIETLNLLHSLLGDGPAAVSVPIVTANFAVESYLIRVGSKRVLLVFTGRTTPLTSITKIEFIQYGKEAPWTAAKYTIVTDLVGNGRTESTYTAGGTGVWREINLAESLIRASVLMFELPE